MRNQLVNAIDKLKKKKGLNSLDEAATKNAMILSLEMIDVRDEMSILWFSELLCKRS